MGGVRTTRAGPSRGLARVGYQREIDELELDLKRLLVEFERFFNGALPIPPEEERAHLGDRLRRLRGDAVLAPADQFRLNALEARFNSFSQLFRRRLQEREAGLVPAHRTAAPAAAAAGARPVALDAGLEEDAVEALYGQFLAASSTAEPVGLLAFRAYLGRQLAAIRERTGAARVELRVVTQGGKIRLKARLLDAHREAHPPGA